MAHAGYNGVVKLDASPGGSLTDYSAYCNSLDVSTPVDLFDTTAFGDSSRERAVAGLKDFSFTVSGDADATFIAVLAGLRGSSQTVSYELGPTGSTAGYIKYTGECMLESFDVSASVDDKVTYTASFQGSGAVTIGTY